MFSQLQPVSLLLFCLEYSHMEDVPYDGVVHGIQGKVIAVNISNNYSHMNQILNYPFLSRAMLTKLSTRINMFSVSIPMNLLRLIFCNKIISVYLDVLTFLR